MEGSQVGVAEVVAAGEGAFAGEVDEVDNAGRDEFHGAGDEAGMGGGDGIPLVGVDADAEYGFAGAFGSCNLLEGAVAGDASGAEDDVSALVEGLFGCGGAPLGIDEGLRDFAGMVGRDDVDVRVHGPGTGDVALVKGDDGGHEIGAEDGGNRTGLGEAAGEYAGEIAGVVLVKDEPGDVGHRLALELVDTDEVDIGIVSGGGEGGITQGEADADDYVVASVDELLDIVSVVFGVLRFNVLEVVFGQTEAFGGSDDAFPSGLVEAAVVDAADVCYEADFEVAGHAFVGGCAGICVGGRHSGGSGAGGKEEGQRGEDCE